MTRDSAAAEYAAAARDAAEAATGVTNTVQRMHQAIARRPFEALGAAAAPAKLLHDGISDVVYASVRTGLRAGGTLGAAAAAAAGMTRPPGSLLDSTIGRAAAGIAAGAFGERVLTSTAGMTVRLDGEAIAVDRAAMARAYPEASGHVVVFLHGLIETERWWYPRQGENPEPRVDFGARLAADIGCTPVYLRYHTGRHISDNGRELDTLLSGLLEAWPAPVDRLSIVGHSMGGLVARSAVFQAVRGGRPWSAKLAHLICLGAPHTGAPLEVGAHRLSWLLRKLPETAPLGQLLELRSEGIKDLRYGDLHDEQWANRDPDVLVSRTKRPQVVLPDGARQHFLSATIARSHDGLLGRTLGDALVPPASAADESQEADRSWVGGLHHFDLLHHDEVYHRVRDWLTDTPVADTPTPRARRTVRRLLRRKRPAG